MAYHAFQEEQYFVSSIVFDYH